MPGLSFGTYSLEAFRDITQRRNSIKVLCWHNEWASPQRWVTLFFYLLTLLSSLLCLVPSCWLFFPLHPLESPHLITDTFSWLRHYLPYWLSVHSLRSSLDSACSDTNPNNFLGMASKDLFNILQRVTFDAQQQAFVIGGVFNLKLPMETASSEKPGSVTLQFWFYARDRQQFQQFVNSLT